MVVVDNAAYVVEGEISLIITAMSRSSKWASYQQYNSHVEPLINALSQLRDVLRNKRSVFEAEPAVLLQPFLDVIRSDFTTGPVTSLALTSVTKFLNYGLLNVNVCDANSASPPATASNRAASVSVAMENIVNSATHARFVGTEPSSDEVVLMRILELLRAVLANESGRLLSNESVCEMLQACFRVCFETRLSELLRKIAEQCLTEMTRTIFSRIGEFHEAPESTAATSNFGSASGSTSPPVGVGGQLTLSRRSRMPIGMTDTKAIRRAARQQAASASVAGNASVQHQQQQQQQKTFSVTSSSVNESSAAPAPALTPKNEEGSLPSAPAATDAAPDQAQSQTSPLAEAADAEASTVPQTSGNEQPENTAEEAEATPNGESTTPSVARERDDFELIEKRDAVASDGDEPRAESFATNSSAATLYELGPADGAAARRATSPPPPTTTTTASSGTTGGRPSARSGEWGLPALRELLRFLTSIINPTERQNSETMMSCGLQLLAVAIECAGSRLRTHRSVLRIIQHQALRNLVRLLTRPTTRVSQYASVLRCCFLLAEALREELRWPLEYLFRKLLDIIAGGDAALAIAAAPGPVVPTPSSSPQPASAAPRWSSEQRELALETLGALWRLPDFLTEIFVNYDCTPQCFDVLENSVQLLGRLAYPATGAVSNVHLLSLDALLTLVDVLEQSCCARAQAAAAAGRDAAIAASNSSISSGVTGSSLSVRTDGDNVSSDGSSGRRSLVPTPQDLANRKRRKLLLQYGTEQFNSKPSKGIQFLVDNGVLHSPPDPDELAAFLRENSGIDKRVLGDYISTRRNADILRAFVRSFAFENVPIDEALRTYLEAFRLPGEAGPIQLVLEHFAEWWHESNGEPFASHDAAFTLAYSVIMLNTDQHNPNSRRQNVPMKAEDFKRNLRGVNGGKNFDDTLLERIYESIRNEEIVLPDEQSGALREGFEWKMIRRKMESDEIREAEATPVSSTVSLPSSGGSTGAYTRVANGTFDQEVFALCWGRIVSALCFVVDKCADETIVARAVSGFRQCASIAAHLALTDVVDKLVISLCKFSGLLSPALAQPAVGAADHEAAAADAIAQQLAGSFKAQLVTRTVFQLVHRHGDFIRDGWRNVLDSLVQLYRAQLLPEVFVDVEDFLSPVGHISLNDVRRAALLRVAQAAQAAASSGVVSSLFAYFTSSSTSLSSMAAADAHGERTASGEEPDAARRAQDCVTECHLEQLTQDCKFLRTDSLHELLKALAVGATNGSCTHDAQVLATSLLDENEAALSGHIFFLELLVRVVLQNRDRIAPLWAVCRRYFALVLTEARQPTFLIERAAIGLVRIAIRLLRREDVAADVLHALNLLALMRPTVLCAVSPQLAAGLHDLVQTNPSNIRGAAAWRTVCTLLQTAGAGLLLPDPRRRALLASFAELAPANAPTGSSTSAPPMPAAAPADDDEERRHWIILPELCFQSHELRALVRSCETLGFIVHAPANLVSRDNFAMCVQTIRVFIEATINLGTVVATPANASQPNAATAGAGLNLDVRRTGGPLLASAPVTRGAVVNLRQATVEQLEEAPSSKSKAASRKPTRKGRSEKQTRSADAATSPTQSLLSPVNSDDDEANFEDAYKNITVSELFKKLSLEMLELLYSLHTRALNIYSAVVRPETEAGSSAGTTTSSEAAAASASAVAPAALATQFNSGDVRRIWLEWWCPALSAIARLCCDHMRTVRSHALTYLQRCLLMPELRALGPVEWSACFRVILFPLLECLLSNDVAPHDACGLEETRMRLTTLVCKVFLQHLHLLAQRTRIFLDLWFTVLDYLDKYVRLEQNESLSEAIPESLKNLLLVIDTTKVFETASLRRTSSSSSPRTSTSSTGQQAQEQMDKLGGSVASVPEDDQDTYTYTYTTRGLGIDMASEVPLGSQLWELTWQRIDKFLPELKHEMLLSTMIHQQQLVLARRTSPNPNATDANADSIPAPKVADCSAEAAADTTAVAGNEPGQAALAASCSVTETCVTICDEVNRSDDVSEPASAAVMTTADGESAIQAESSAAAIPPTAAAQQAPASPSAQRRFIQDI